MHGEMRAPGHRGSAFPGRAAQGSGPVAEMATRVAVALVVALAFSPLIREVTAGLTSTVGAQWPFVLEHCRTSATPGCAVADLHPALARLAAR